MRSAGHKTVVLCSNTSHALFNFRLGVITSFLSEGFEVVCVCPQDDFTPRLQALGCKVVLIRVNRRSINPIEDLKLLYALFKIYKQIKPDLIFHYTIKPNIYGSIAARLASIRSIAITTGLGYTFSVNNWLSSVVKLLYKIAFTFPNQVWFLNNEDKSSFIENKIIPASKAVILDSEGVDTAHYYFHPTQTTHRAFTFLLIARMLKEKGIEDYVKAASIVKKVHPETTFLLLGGFDEGDLGAISRSQVDHWVGQGLVNYLGQVSDVRHIIKTSDCIVLPSYYREGIPRSLLEAASMGRPIITSNSVGCKEAIIDGVTGFLCRVKDPDDLAEKMLNLLTKSGDERKMFGAHARQYILSRFDEKIIVKQYIETVYSLD